MKTKLKTASPALAPKEEKRFDPYQAVTHTILQHLENGVVPWRKPWDASVGRPCNLSSGHPYQGINVLLLGVKRFASPYWLTMRQANDLGGQVRKGERGTLIVKAGRHEKRVKGQEEETQTRYFLRGYTVFNVLQIDGIELSGDQPREHFAASQRIEAAERIVTQMQAKPEIIEAKTVQSCYRMSSDTIEMPGLSRFESAEMYHLVLFHELIHATGHQSRLDRQSLVNGGPSVMREYSKEELVAEMGAAFLGMEAGIVQDDHEQSAAYLESWLQVLGEPNRKRWIVEAASQASKAAKFILGIE